MYVYIRNLDYISSPTYIYSSEDYGDSGSCYVRLGNIESTCSSALWQLSLFNELQTYHYIICVCDDRIARYIITSSIKYFMLFRLNKL